jgi:hypothetical protein
MGLSRCRTRRGIHQGSIGGELMKNITLEELELLDVALNTYRETLEARKDRESLHTLEELQNSIREEWRYIKGWDI